MYDGPVVDVCINHTWPNQLELMKYMSAGWREYLGRPNALPNGGGLISISPGNPYRRPGGIEKLPETKGPQGELEGSSYEMLKSMLDKHRVERAVLTFDVAAFTPALLHPYLTLDIARATNDWTIDRWLGLGDPRLASLMMVPNQLPLESALEIRRLATHPAIVGVLLGANGLGKTFGHPAYHPIYEAAAEFDLPLVIKSGSESVPESLTSPTGVGVPATFSEAYAFSAQPMMTHVAGMIVQGVFDKFPNLRVLLLGGGSLWVPAMMWRFDNNYRGLRRDAPWMRRLPSEYFLEHVRVGTNPLEKFPAQGQFHRALEAMKGLRNTMCFASGYPNWDSETPDVVAEQLPESWQQKVMHDNACALFGFPDHAGVRADVATPSISLESRP